MRLQAVPTDNIHPLAHLEFPRLVAHCPTAPPPPPHRARLLPAPPPTPPGPWVGGVPPHADGSQARQLCRLAGRSVGTGRQSEENLGVGRLRLPTADSTACKQEAPFMPNQLFVAAPFLSLKGGGGGSERVFIDIDPTTDRDPVAFRLRVKNYFEGEQL